MNCRSYTCVLLVVFWVAHSHRAQADVVITPEGRMAHYIARSMDSSRALRGEPLPTNWDQLGAMIDLPRLNAQRRRAGRPSLEELYQFASKPLALPEEPGSRVLLIRSVPLEKDWFKSVVLRQPRRFRYVVFERAEGGVYSTRLKEEVLQALLQAAGVTLAPPKTGLPAVEYESSAFPSADAATVPLMVVLGLLTLWVLFRLSPVSATSRLTTALQRTPTGGAPDSVVGVRPRQ